MILEEKKLNILPTGTICTCICCQSGVHAHTHHKIPADKIANKHNLMIVLLPIQDNSLINFLKLFYFSIKILLIYCSSVQKR